MKPAVKALQDKGLPAAPASRRRRTLGQLTPAEHSAEIKKEFEKMKHLVKVQNIKLEQ
ncbi:hypothetical protein ACU4GD_42905 [Cupriavidus basilensis]